MTATLIHISIAPAWESPPIRKGSREQRFWKYQQRMERFDRLKDNYEKQKGRKLLMNESLWFGGLYMDTFDHIEALGHEMTEGEFGEPTWLKK
jgi:hypothetical protein